MNTRRLDLALEAERHESTQLGYASFCADEGEALPDTTSVFMVWEGSATKSMERPENMFSFTGAWRAANEEEMCRLYTGHFPLRGTPFPTESDKAPERFG